MSALGGGATVELKGKGMSVLKREPGGWKFLPAINKVVPFTPAPRWPRDSSSTHRDARQPQRKRRPDGDRHENDQ
jgi:hypothetical protein